MKNYRRLGVRVYSIVIVGVLAFGSVAAAQKGEVAVTDGEFATFVTVNVDLQSLSDEYQAAFDKAGEDAAKRAALQREVQEKSRDVLARHNLTAERYREIFEVVNSDPALRTKALQQIQQEREKR
jgi:hypothetical protein